MRIVEKRDRDTLLPIIKSQIELGSTIFSDQWGAYFTLNEEGYKHDTVNHSKEFKSATGVCTNGIEGLWGNVKLKIKKMKGVLPNHVPEILDEYMYSYRFGKSNGDVYATLIEDIAKYQYFLIDWLTLHLLVHMFTVKYYTLKLFSFIFIFIQCIYIVFLYSQ